MPALLIIAHAPLASALREVARHVYEEAMPKVAALDVEREAAPADIVAQARALLAETGESEALVLADVFGATPFNAGLELADGVEVRLVTGVNVPMLWRTLCYLNEPLGQLVQRAIDGAQQGVMQVSIPRPQNQRALAGSDDQVHRHHQQ